MTIGDQTLTVAGFIRDAQMNPMIASSKRFLVSAADYELLRRQGEEEYLIEFLLQEDADRNSFQTAYAAWGFRQILGIERKEIRRLYFAKYL